MHHGKNGPNFVLVKTTKYFVLALSTDVVVVVSVTKDKLMLTSILVVGIIFLIFLTIRVMRRSEEENEKIEKEIRDRQ